MSTKGKPCNPGQNAKHGDACVPKAVQSGAKNNRYVRLLSPFDGERFVILIWEQVSKTRRTEEVYTVVPYPTEIGEGFIFSKKDAADSTYRCCVEDDQNMWCECPGFELAGHCKHLESLFALRAKGKI